MLQQHNIDYVSTNEQRKQPHINGNVENYHCPSIPRFMSLVCARVCVWICMCGCVCVRFPYHQINSIGTGL